MRMLFKRSHAISMNYKSSQSCVKNNYKFIFSSSQRKQQQQQQYGTKRPSSSSNKHVETYDTTPVEPKKVTIIRPKTPTTASSNMSTTTTSSSNANNNYTRLDRALTKSEMRPLSDLKYLYVSNTGAATELGANIDEKLVEKISNIKFNYRKWTVIAFLVGSAIVFACILRANLTNAGRDEVYRYAKLILSSDDDYLHAEDLPSRSQYAQLRVIAFKRLYAFCENAYNWPLLKNCQVVQIWARVLKRSDVGNAPRGLPEDESSLLCMSKALNRLMDSAAFHTDIQSSVDPRDIYSLLAAVIENRNSGDAVSRKQKALLISQLTTLSKRLLSIADASYLKSNTDSYVTTIEKMITSDRTEFKRIGFHALAHLVSVGAIEDYPDLKVFCDKLYEKYATNVDEFKKVSDADIKQSISDFAICYEDRFRDVVKPRMIKTFKKQDKLSWNYIRDTLLESDISKTGQIYVLGGASYMLFRMYWRYWRFGGVNGRHMLFNYAWPHAKRAFMVMTPIFAYQALATLTWEKHLFESQQTNSLGISQQFVPAIAALKYGPVIGAVSYMILTNSMVPFLIAPLLYGLLQGNVVITPTLIGYMKEDQLSIDELKRIREETNKKDD